MNEMITLRPIAIRPNVRTHAKKDDFVSPSDAPGEGNRRFPTRDERDEPETKVVNPIKKFLMDVFKIKEIDYEKFNVRKISGLSVHRRRIRSTKE
jgi:hypothetical protein